MLARDGYTEQEVKNALHGRSGSRQIKFRFDVIQNGAVVKSVVADGSVSLSTENTIQRTAQFTLYEEIDWLKDEIKPVFLLRMPDSTSGTVVYIMPCSVFDSLNLTAAQFDALNLTGADIDNGFYTSGGRSEKWIEFPLGVVVPSTPTRQSEDAETSWAVEAYDRTVILKEDCFIENAYYAAGTSYLSVINDILLDAGVENVLSDSSDEVLAADREFEYGTSRLEAVNALLSEINFNPIFCDADGNFVLEKYVEATAANPDYTYAADDLSVIGRDTQSEIDSYAIPNIFIAVCSNPDLDEDYRSVWVNNNPASRLSTVQRGRNIVSEIYQPDSITSQDALDAYIAKIGQEATLRGYEQFTFITALMPIHGSGDVLNISHPDVSGTFVESEWSMDLSHDAEMSHTAKRIVML